MSDTKWTPGPWVVEGRTVYALNDHGFNRFSAWVQDPHTDHKELEANARLIAAAPDGFWAAHYAYLSILQSPMTAWRVDQGMNGVLAGLRDFIAKATNRDPCDVQDEYQAIAAARGEQS